MILLALSLFLTVPAPLEMPRAQAYLVESNGVKRLEDRFLRIDLWTSRTVTGRWLDDDGRVFTLARLETHPPAVSAEGSVSRAQYAAQTVAFDKRKVLKGGVQSAAFRDALSRLSPVEISKEASAPRMLPRGFADVDYWHGTNESAVVCTFLPEGGKVWRLAVWELAPGDDFAECVKAFEREFLEKEYARFAAAGRDTESVREARPSKRRRFSEREELRRDAHHCVLAYDGWRFTDSQEFTILNNLPGGGAFVSALTNELPVMRLKYAAALPTPLDSSDVLCVARIFATREEYLETMAVDGITNMAWSAAYWSPLRRELVAHLSDGGSDRLIRTFRHEAFHQYLSYATAMIPVSAWLNEGYAQYFEDESSDDWELGAVPGPEDIERFAQMLPALFMMDYDAFYSGSDDERRMKYRLAWSVAVFMERAMREIRHDPFETFKADYIAALFRSKDMVRATREAFRSKDRLELFISCWSRFWSGR